jgi:hypothetical protein
VPVAARIENAGDDAVDIRGKLVLRQGANGQRIGEVGPAEGKQRAGRLRKDLLRRRGGLLGRRYCL